MTTEIEQLEQGITTLEAQRASLGDALIDTLLAPLREKLAALKAAEAAPASPARKQMTILFADISGFTAMSETMDAEDVSDTMNALWTRLDDAITSHKGSIDKHIGDAVMALWGVDEAREDDAENAVRAALAMQAVIMAFSAERGRPLQLRIGINTGMVLYSAIGTVGEWTAMGDTVNVASRMEHAAPIGGILIAHNTYIQVRGSFDVQAQPPLMVKGKSEPIQAYLVERAKPRTFRFTTRGVEGVETRMIGRDAELSNLQTAFHSVLSEAKTRLISIIGDAGVGKSRLLYEFDTWLELQPERVRYFKGRATQQGTSTPYFLLRDLFANRFNILDSDPIAEVREKFTVGISFFAETEPETQAAFIGALLGYGFADSPQLESVKHDAKQLRDQALFYLVRFFTAVASTGAVILLEDLHWADQTSLDTILHILRECPALRLLIIGVTRPTLLETYPQWPTQAADFSPAQSIRLEPLDEQAIGSLVDHILQRTPDIPPTLRALIVKQAEGNPYYVEELIKMLIDDRVIVTSPAGWTVAPDRLKELHIPPTLTALLQARLDSLRPSEKETLQQASVVGRIFWDASVAALRKGNMPTEFEVLQARELIFARPVSAFNTAGEYIFKHVLLRDVTYETVLRKQRRLYHGLVAAWLAEVTQKSGRADEYAALIADHYALAEQPAPAISFLQQAAEGALTIGSAAEASQLIERALSLIASLPASAEVQRQHMMLLRLAGETAVRLSDYPKAQQHYQESLRKAREVDDKTGMVSALVGLGETAVNLGDYAAAQEHYQQSLPDASPRYRAQALGGLGKIAWRQGNYAAANEHFQQSLTLQREINDPTGIGTTLRNLGNVAWSQGDYDQAGVYYKQSITLQRKINDRLGMSGNLNNLGLIAYTQEQLEQAQNYFQQSLVMSRQIGNRAGEGSALANLGSVAYAQKEYARAAEYHQQSLAARRLTGDLWGIAMSLGGLTEVQIILGQLSEAHISLREGLKYARQIGGTPLLLTLMTLASQLYLHDGHAEQAAAWAGLVAHHPITQQQERDASAHLRPALEAALGAEAVTAAMERGKLLDLDAVVAHLLGEP
ncbi:MAG: tetratricopeptide repeat protein [Anaerolineae bacterium]|nr:tetratricopeptide repeat protein [Anaerolineae bacterium]